MFDFNEKKKPPQIRSLDLPLLVMGVRFGRLNYIRCVVALSEECLSSIHKELQFIGTTLTVLLLDLGLLD